MELPLYKGSYRQRLAAAILEDVPIILNSKIKKAFKEGLSKHGIKRKQNPHASLPTTNGKATHTYSSSSPDGSSLPTASLTGSGTSHSSSNRLVKGSVDE